jgi:hypothetical protein
MASKIEDPLIKALLEKLEKEKGKLEQLSPLMDNLGLHKPSSVDPFVIEKLSQPDQEKKMTEIPSKKKKTP